MSSRPSTIALPMSEITPRIPANYDATISTIRDRTSHTIRKNTREPPSLLNGMNHIKTWRKLTGIASMQNFTAGGRPGDNATTCGLVRQPLCGSTECGHHIDLARSLFPSNKRQECSIG